ncbi:MAG: DUF167 domain-containing protein [Nanoarchaeota archaeon]
MIIKVLVTPNSKKDEIEQLSDKEYKASIKEKSENNKANIKLLKLLSRYFGVAQSDIKIKNPKSRKKIIEIKK